MSNNIKKLKYDLLQSNSSNLGSVLSFGSVHLLLTLNLTKEDLTEYEINFDNIKSLENIPFLKENPSLWDRIELTSPDPTLKMFLYTNKVASTKTKIKHMCFRKMKYLGEQREYIEMVEEVLNKHKIDLTSSYDVCKCILSIQLVIYCRLKRKVLVLCGDRIPIDDDDKDLEEPREADNSIVDEGGSPLEPEEVENVENEEEEEDEGKEHINKLIKIPLCFANPSEHDYIYFKYSDYASQENGSFGKKISLEDLYEYFVYLKTEMGKVKIVLNICNEDGENTKNEIFKKILGVTDINIFYNKSTFYEILKYLKYLDDKNEQIEGYFKHLIESKSKEIRKRLSQEDLPTSEAEKKYKKEIEAEIKNIYENNQMPELIEPKVLDKLNMFHYYQNGIINKDPLKNTICKKLIVLDDFSKIYFVQCYKDQEKPIILDFDMKLYPQINIYKISVVKKYKDFIKERFDEYVLILISCLLSSLLHNNGQNDDNNLFIGYLSAVNVIKKLLEYEINDIQIPKGNNFYYPRLNDNEVQKLLTQIEQKKKENKFVLDCNNANQIKLKTYNPILDKNLFYFFNYEKQNFLRSKGFISKKGNVLYDPVYKENFKRGLTKKNSECNKNIFGKTVYEMKIMRKYNANPNKIKINTVSDNLYGTNNKSNFYSESKTNGNNFSMSKRKKQNYMINSKSKDNKIMSRYKLK